MPDDLHVIPWEQFNTYNREIMEKVESLDTTSANSGDVLTYTSGSIGWTSPYPSTANANDGDVLTYDSGQFEWQTPSSDGDIAEQLLSIGDCTADSGFVLMTSSTGDGVAWVPKGNLGMPSAENASEGDVLTYTSNSGHYTWRTPYPSTNDASEGDVLSYNGHNLEWGSPFPNTESIDNHPKVLTYASGEGFYWDTELPSTNNAINGDVLTYNGENLEWKTPESELPDTSNASNGYILTYHSGEFEWAANNALPEWEISTEGGETLIVVSGASGEESKTLSWAKTLGGIPLDYSFLDAIDEVSETDGTKINGIISVKSVSGVEGPLLELDRFNSDDNGKVLAINENGQIYAANIQDLLNN